MRVRTVSGFPVLGSRLSHNRSKENFVDRAFQPEPGGTLATPAADYFLAFAVIVRRRVVSFGGHGTVLLCDADHAYFRLSHIG